MRLWHLHEAVSHNIEKRLSAWARFRPASKYHSWWVEIVLERSAPEEVPGNWRMVTIFVIECGPTADIADELPSDEEWGEDRSWYASRDKDLAFLRIGRPEQLVLDDKVFTPVEEDVDIEIYNTWEDYLEDPYRID